MTTILFQGDSITDVGRDRQNIGDLGKGYPNLVGATLGFENPEKYTFIDKGISGNRIVDVYARIKDDILNLKPDVMSILIGVNDVWHEFDFNNGITAEKFEKLYRILLDEIIDELPNIKIMILEPFCLLGPATEKNWNNGFDEEVKLRAAVAKKIAKEYNLTFIPLQDKFDEAAKTTENTYWLFDGVHPSTAGHELIKREWIKAFNTLGL
ncbi:MAG: SGNH/GDSL hydrolase family protein [Eubacteriales bacterium]|nr:SGNH/GDSL hydrolase family protein [Eubacteriales bacterium]